MSSAEDTTSSTVSASTASSNSAPEEFPVEPRRQEERKEQGSSSEASAPFEVSATDDSPAPSAAKLREDEVTPLRTKPLPRVNGVAREIQVRVTGARAGAVSDERELFSELTTTVLVFENGGVIRLMAAVTPGQLLFVNNEESKREVIAQVTRKRAHRPTGCFAELEFTQPAPGFWGMEFSAATPLLPKDAKEIAAFELVASAETTADELDGAVPPASAEEVEALRKEVEALRSQLKLLQTPDKPDQTESTGAIPQAPFPSPVDMSEPQAETPGYQTEKIQWAELAADVAPIQQEAKKQEAKPARAPTANQDLLPKPALDFHIPVPKHKRSFRARGQFTPGFRTGMLRLAILSFALVALIGAAWYKHKLPWMHEPTRVSTWAGGVTTKVATPRPLTPGPVAAETPTVETASGNAPGVSVKEVPSHLGLSSENPVGSGVANEKGINSTAPVEVVEKPAAREKSKSASVEKVSPVRSAPTDELPTKAIAAVQGLPPSAHFVPPKLVQSQRAVASLEDLHDFETGSVVIDAIIDTTGNVTSPTVLTGPPSLRKPALEALKYYKYIPAVLNGQPVAAHVSIKIQFHFE